jgi:gluconate:H+ symporter, GntP family
LWLPISLLGLKAICQLYFAGSNHFIMGIIRFLGEPIMALCVGILVALPLLASRTSSQINSLCNNGFSKSGHILAIEAAGGIFGEIVKIAISKVNLENYIFQIQNFWIFIPFLLTAFFKTAYGSSTVAVISAVSILQPLMTMLEVDTAFEIQLFLLALGAGSMLVSHANDAYFG